MTTEVQEYSKTEAALAALRESYANAKYDVTKAAEMKAARTARAEIRGYRVDLEKMRKEIKAPALERCRLIDSEAKRITGELLKLEQPIDEQIKAEEARKEAERQAAIEAEERRVATIQEHIADFGAYVEKCVQQNLPAERVEAMITELSELELTEDRFQEFLPNAQDARNAALSRLREIHAATVEREAEAERIAAEREELERLRKADAERQAKERAEREKAEAEARAKREAEEAAERKRLEAQRKEQEAEQKRLAAERAEIDRQQREAAKKAETERKAAEKARADAKKAKYPGDQAIIAALSEYFDVPQDVAQSWLARIRKAA